MREAKVELFAFGGRMRAARRRSVPRRHLRWSLLGIVLSGGMAMYGYADPIEGNEPRERIDAKESMGMSDLPDAPAMGVAAGEFVGQVDGLSSRQQAAFAEGAVASGSISGTVLDIREAIVPGAKVALTVASRAGEPAIVRERVVLSGSDGRFSFADVTAGSYRIVISADGLETFVSDEIVLRVAEKYELPEIALPIGSATANVQVTVTEDQLAEEQVQAAVQQRVLGVFPNFYTSFIWNAAPLKPRHKFQLAIRSTTDPISFLTTGVIAGVDQARDRFPGYGQGMQGYAKRYGAAYGDSFIGRMIGGAILPSLFHQDPRYFYKGSGSISSRLGHALASAVICRGDNGKWQPNYSHVLGNFAAGEISNLYRPEEDRGVGLAINNALIHTGGNAVANVMREFVLRGFTTKVPSYAIGKQ
jgi:Carboxypeptidase regulatory-like domain